MKIKNLKCRLCNKYSIFLFKKKILKKYIINYFKCKNCESIQTENPYWLKEAYKEWLTKFDTGIFSRVSLNFLVSFLLCKIFNLSNIIDYGGGDGLFTRILRDYHLNCYNYDAYSKSIYAKNFTKPNFKKADMVTSFEAVEHFSNPQKEFNKMFKFKPHFALITTKLFSGQKKNWDYFEYETGQHIFFYTKKALRIIAKKFNYNIVYLEYGYILFYSKKYKLSNISIFMLKNILIKRKFFPFIKIFAMFFNSNGYEKDYIKSKYN